MNLQTKKRAQASPVTITKLRDLCKENVPCFKNCSSALVYTRVKYCLDKNNISVLKDRATNKPYCNLTSEKLQKLYKKLNEKYSLPEQQNEKKIAFSTKSLMKEVLEGSREECVTSGYCVSGKSYVYRGIYWQILPALENGLIEKQEGKQKEMILLASKTVYLNLVNKYIKMKKKLLPMSVLFVGLSLNLFSSCAVGSFTAMNWCFNLNNTLTANKYLNAVIGFVLSPFEFAIGGFADCVILNTVEFWTGSNPMASTQVVLGSDGNLYAIAPIKNGGYKITNQTTGKELTLQFEAKTKTWTAVFDEYEVNLFSLKDENHAIVNTPNGQTMEISLDEAGLVAYEEMLFESNLAMK